MLQRSKINITNMPREMEISLRGECSYSTWDITHIVHRLLALHLAPLFEVLFISALYSWQCNKHLSCIVSSHDDDTRVGHRKAELVNCNGQIRHHEKHRADAGRELGPCPEVVAQLHAGDRSPAHEANQGDVDSYQVGEWAREVGVQEGITGTANKAHQEAGLQVQRLHAKGWGVQDVCDGEHQQTMNEVALLLPDEKGISHCREYQSC